MDIEAPEPAKRHYVDPVSDSARWAAFQPRIGDIVVSTPAKCGTTWTQSILAMLIMGRADIDAEVMQKWPWIDNSFRDLDPMMARLVAQDHRRQVKSHTPLDGVPFWQDLRYITVYRHPIDAFFSFRKHMANLNTDKLKDLVLDQISEDFARFLTADGDHLCLHSIVTHYQASLEKEPRGNVLRLHYRQMQRDLPGSIAQIAGHVCIDCPDALKTKMVKAAGFDAMKANAHRFAPAAGQGVWRDDAGFFDSGSNNKWEGQLSDDDLAAYDTAIAGLLSAEQRAWLEWGE